MVSLANCYAKYVFFKIFALLLSSSWLMQRQMSPTEGLVKYSVLEIQEFKLTCQCVFDNRNEFDTLTPHSTHRRV